MVDCESYPQELAIEQESHLSAQAAGASTFFSSQGFGLAEVAYHPPPFKMNEPRDNRRLATEPHSGHSWFLSAEND